MLEHTKHPEGVAVTKAQLHASNMAPVQLQCGPHMQGLPSYLSQAQAPYTIHCLACSVACSVACNTSLTTSDHRPTPSYATIVSCCGGCLPAGLLRKALPLIKRWLPTAAKAADTPTVMTQVRSRLDCLVKQMVHGRLNVQLLMLGTQYGALPQSPAPAA